MIAGKCSGFDTDLVTQTSGVVIATLQMQGGGGVNVPHINDASISSFDDFPKGVQSTEQRPPMTSQGDPLTISTSFNSSSTVEEPMLTDLRAD